MLYSSETILARDDLIIKCVSGMNTQPVILCAGISKIPHKSSTDCRDSYEGDLIIVSILLNDHADALEPSHQHWYRDHQTISINKSKINYDLFLIYMFPNTLT